MINKVHPSEYVGGRGAHLLGIKAIFENIGLFRGESIKKMPSMKVV